MASQKTQNSYAPSIGIECHVQLNTETKLFAAVSNDAREAAPNTLISHICLGMPGALPVLNEKVIESAIKVARAFNVRPQKYSYFERKHYFYPDLPKGYQITQLEHPIIKGGYVEIDVAGSLKRINLNRVQIEEDAGKSIHPAGKNYSLVDLNRAGTPLLEIVSEPDIKSPEEAKLYVKELYLLMRYSGVSDADLFHGNMRFDVNVSVSNDPDRLGTRTETKNLNSFRSVEKAVEFEIKRQVKLLEKGEDIVQETRGWDDAKQKTFSQRGKEAAHDYRYFPDPDLPPIELEDEFIDRITSQVSVLPAAWRDSLESVGLDKSQVETLLDAELIQEDVEYLSLIQSSLEDKEFARNLSNWLVNVEIPLRSKQELPNQNATEDRLGFYRALYNSVKAGELSSTSVKALITAVVQDNTELKTTNALELAETKGLVQVSNESEIEKVVDQVIAENQQAAEDVRSGELKAIGFLVGQVMKASKGKANPGLAQQLIKKKLS